MKTGFIAISFIILLLISCKNKQVDEASNHDVTIESADSIQLSLAQWSFHRAIKSGKMNHLDFAKKAADLGFVGIEYVNQFFKEKATDTAYLAQMNEVAHKANIRQLLIMIDEEGNLGDLDSIKRTKAVENHKKWVDAAAYLGCHSIRVNAAGEGDSEAVSQAAIKGLKQLSLYAAEKNINVIVENHGGYSSNGKWLANVIASIQTPNCGTLPDFGNFCIKSSKNKSGQSTCEEMYDKYQGVSELMPFAKAVSAKSFDFGELGFETTIDYPKMIDIVQKSGYRGYIGVEYEGDSLGEEAGIIATKKLIEKCLKPSM